MRWEPGWQSPSAAPAPLPPRSSCQRACSPPASEAAAWENVFPGATSAFPPQCTVVVRAVREWSPLNTGSVPRKEAAAAFWGSALTLRAAGAANTFFSFYALRSSCDLFLLDLFGSFSPWEGSRLGVFQPVNVLLYTSSFALTFI